METNYCYPATSLGKGKLKRRFALVSERAGASL
jgi:hypothetical protein